MISTNLTRAHLRILMTIPRERIRTHERTFAEERQHGKKVGAITQPLIDEVKPLLLAGATYDEVCERLTMSKALLRRIAEVIKSELAANRREVIFDLLRREVSERAIARLLGLSRTTVQKHKRALAKAKG